LETEWVLRATYSFDRNRIASDFRGLLGLSIAQVEDAAAVTKALEWFTAGVDFADALHLASSTYASAFATFDRGLAQRARRLQALPVVAP
jgi:predicted nucleic-acid-binding protein